MIGIGQDNGSAQLFERVLRERSDRGGGSHGHKHRSFDYAVRSAQATAARTGWIGLQYFEGKTHLASVSGECRPDSGPDVTPPFPVA